METFWSTSHAAGAQSSYLESLYESYLDNPSSIPNDWKIYFDSLPSIAGAQEEVSHKEIIEKLLEDDVKMNETLLKGTEGGISDKELNMILDRDLVMGKKKIKVKGKKVNIPWDGKGYQIVEHKAESLVGSSTHTGKKMKQSP